MPVFISPPIYHPPIIETVIVHQVMIDDLERIEKSIINGVLCSKEGYVLVKVGEYTLRNIKTRYQVPKEALGQIMLDIGKIGIASKLVMSESLPNLNTGSIYLLATRDSKILEKNRVKMF